jgi:hypothetical protein
MAPLLIQEGRRISAGVVTRDDYRGVVTGRGYQPPTDARPVPSKANV